MGINAAFPYVSEIHFKSVLPGKSLLRNIGDILPLSFLLRDAQNATCWPDGDLQCNDTPAGAKTNLTWSPRACVAVQIRDAVADKCEFMADTPDTDRLLGTCRLIHKERNSGTSRSQEQSYSHAQKFAKMKQIRHRPASSRSKF